MWFPERVGAGYHIFMHSIYFEDDELCSSETIMFKFNNGDNKLCSWIMMASLARKVLDKYKHDLSNPKIGSH